MRRTMFLALVLMVISVSGAAWGQTTPGVETPVAPAPVVLEEPAPAPPGPGLGLGYFLHHEGQTFGVSNSWALTKAPSVRLMADAFALTDGYYGGGLSGSAWDLAFEPIGKAFRINYNDAFVTQVQPWFAGIGAVTDNLKKWDIGGYVKWTTPIN